MKFLRIAVLALVSSQFGFGASKEIIELQRDVALLQDKVDTMQRDLDTKLGELSAMMQQLQDNNAKSNSQIQDAVTNGVGRQLAPVSGMSSKVDAMGDDVRSLKDALNDLSARLERMDAKITDLKNQMQIIQNPPPAPGSAPANGAPTAVPGTGAPAGPAASNVPPPGMSAEKTYTDARRDLQTGNVDLATQEFQQYLTYYPDTELAANAQYYLGEIAFNKADYPGAIKAFDAVLERYPQNPKTADARLMKGTALLRSGQKTRAIQEFRALVENYPRTDDARKARQQLQQLGASASTSSSSARRR
jgi:tol-pal system protein YbgF